MDFGALPPEVNSARMYAGPGAAPMMVAASAWNSLAAELASAATGYQSVISGLTGEEWLGPASVSMAAAAAPYVAWMSTTAAQAQKAATQATAAAAAYEAAFAMTVPPSVVAANRAQLAALVATNFLGQNTPAIMATEAHYAEMWAQDAAAMYGYAASSATASQLTPFTSPTQTTNPVGIAGQAAVVAQAAASAGGAQTQTHIAQFMSTLPSVLQSMSSPASSTAPASSRLGGIGAILAALGSASASTDYPSVVLNGLSSGSATAMMYIPSTLIPNMIGYFAGPGGNAAGGPVGPLGGGLGALLAPSGPLSALGALGGGAAGSASASTSAVSAGIGHASMVGALTVPPSWAATTPASAAASASQGTGWAAAPETHLAAMPPGIPTGGMGNRNFGFGAPRYGFKPTVMARPVAAG
ncbi:PPE family protein [Mycobacterium botniense]|uniref:PPE family protein n=1 Tax=Mycobacterium botniense TaxID=84962 RepID=A0A7I9XYU8_9MYCO|nr:PPE family protein [Mycobacterium botniense]GFG74907.1 PPE family protein [Mycobacterium botniense]